MLGWGGKKAKVWGSQNQLLQQAGASPWELATRADPHLGPNLDPVCVEGSVLAAARHCVSI